MINKLLKRLGEIIGLSQVEVTGILFFAVMLLTGLIIRQIRGEDSPFPSFDYTKQDSLFLKIQSLNDSLIAAAKVENDSVSTTPRKAKELLNRKINLNNASLSDLTLLPGIGEKTAAKIIEFRKQNGKFKSNKQIMDVSGIGPAKYEKLKDFITVGSK